MAGMEVVVGTYEELLLSYKLTECEEGQKYELQPAFTDHSHSGSVRAVSISRAGILASGGTDEVIKLFNLRRRVEHGSLMHHDGTITSLVFFGRKHMFSGSEDGTVGVWRTGKWECVRTFRGHKGPVYSVAVHPSGKLALSVSKDRTLRTWNLVTGRSAYITNIKEVADIVLWAPSGDKYIVVVNNRLDVYSVETAEVEHTVKYTSRISAVCFIEDDVFALGGEGGIVELHSLSKKAKVHEFSTETNRVKGLGSCKCPDGSSVWLVSGSSDGFIKLWQLACPEDESEEWSATLQAELDTKFRITCLALLPEKRSTVVGQPRGGEVEATVAEEEDDDDDEEDASEGSEDGSEGSEDASEGSEDAEEGSEVEEVTPLPEKKLKPKKQKGQLLQKKRKAATEQMTHPPTHKQKKMDVQTMKKKLTPKKKKRKNKA